jgi:large subunit ribosomal protein L25
MPAVIYGHKTDPLPISVDGEQILELVRHGTHVINVEVSGAQQETCLIKDLQYGYLGDNLIHIDLARVDLDEVVSVQVHLHFVGDLPAAKKPGAILSHDLPGLEVQCRVADIPEEIRVDLSKFPETANHISVSDITLPPGVTTKLDPGTSVVHVSFVHHEAVGEAAAVEAPAEPERIERVKPEGEAEE